MKDFCKICNYFWQHCAKKTRLLSYLPPGVAGPNKPKLFQQSTTEQNRNAEGNREEIVEKTVSKYGRTLCFHMFSSQ